ncbi:MAG TPA: hypothetical protein VL201_01810, partial [Patescibacteria group bacterium]|nr:hypothetical protein [Patescibacteria group bacterium]
MIQRKYFSFFVGGILLLSTPFSISSGIYNLFEKLIFGSSLMPLEDQELCNEVKDFLDVGEDHQLYYSRWPWNYFSSFTQMTGTWIDKETWDNLDLEEKIFIVHHEISHKALKHPLKHYVLALGNFIVIAYCFDKLIKWGRKPSDPVIENLIIQKWGKQVISNR